MATRTISLALPEADLALIDEFSGGNRTAFMTRAAVEAAKALRRAAIDKEIVEGLRNNPESELAAELDGLAGDGLEEDALVISVQR